MIKNRLLFIITIIMISIAGCEGPAGPQGERGFNGSDGIDGVDGSDGSDGADGSANVQTFYASWGDGDYTNPPESGSDILSYVIFENVTELTQQIVESGVITAHWSPSDTNDYWFALPYTYDATNVVEMSFAYTEGEFAVLFTSITGDFIDGDQVAGRVKVSVIPPSQAGKVKTPKFEDSEGYKIFKETGFFNRRE